MKRFLENNWVLILIFIFACLLRFYKIDVYPALNADEASNAFDAYSLILTGMDQHGNPWPVSFQSFNDYKPGLYVYMDILFVKLLGLNVLSARLPGVLAGVFSVISLYLFVLEIFKKSSIFNPKNIALVSAFLLSISPWHIHYSRGGWEVNLSTFFMITGLMFLMRTFNHYEQKTATDSKSTTDINNSKPVAINLFLSATMLAASLYSYHAARVVIPLIGLGIFIIYFKTITSRLGAYSMYFIFLALLLIPLMVNLLSPNSLSRAGGVGIFADTGPLNRVNEQRGEHGELRGKFARSLHNKFVNYGLAFLNNYTLHFDGEFLFMSGDSIERNKVPETGVMYLMDIILLALALCFIARNFNADKNAYSVIFIWLLAGPVASALTFQSPNALRSQNMVIPLVILSSIGLYRIIEYLWKPNRLKLFGIFVLAIFILWNFGRYIHMYWNHMATEYPYSSQYGVGELVEYIEDRVGNYNKIFVTTRYDQPYILFLFYMNYDPSKFQFKHVLTSKDEYGFSTVAEFDKFNFEKIDYNSLSEVYKNSLIVGTPNEIPQTANIIKRIYGSNGFEYFDIVEN